MSSLNVAAVSCICLTGFILLLELQHPVLIFNVCPVGPEGKLGYVESLRHYRKEAQFGQHRLARQQEGETPLQSQSRDQEDLGSGKAPLRARPLVDQSAQDARQARHGALILGFRENENPANGGVFCFV